MRKLTALILAMVLVLTLTVPVAMAATDPTEVATGTTEATGTDATGEGTEATTEGTEAAAEENVVLSQGPETEPTAIDDSDEVLAEANDRLLIVCIVVAVISIGLIVLIIVKRKNMKV